MKPFKFKEILLYVIPAAFLISILTPGCHKKQSILPSKITDNLAIATNSITVSVTSTGAVGDGVHDDTNAFNTAITQVANGGGGTVTVPAGTYLIDPDVSIIMKSNVTLDMIDSTRIIKVKPSSNERYNVIRMHKISNAQVKGGKINGERYQHLGTTGEHGMGVSLYQATNCKVIRTVITDCWGDGVVVGSQSLVYNAPNASVNCVISQVISRNNRRQGLSIGGVDSLNVVNCEFSHTNGTAPQDGIDIEPDYNTAEKVHIKNCLIAYNAKNGIEMNAKTNTTAVIDGVTVEGNYIHHNTHSGYIQHVSNVNFYYNRLINNIWYSYPSGQPPLAHNGDVPYVYDATNSVFTPNTYQ